MLQSHFTGESTQAFALLKFFQSGSAGIAFFYAGNVALQYQLVINVRARVSSPPMCWLVRGFLSAVGLSDRPALPPSQMVFLVAGTMGFMAVDRASKFRSGYHPIKL